MYYKDLDLNSFVNCLWSYFQSYIQSIKKKIYNQENKWLKILNRSKLKLSIPIINKLIRDPNNLFKLIDYKDLDINQIQILKLRYFICLYWLNFLLIQTNNNKKKKVFDFNEEILNNWISSIDNLISVFNSRNEIMIEERDKIYDNLSELEKIRLKCPNLDKVHQIKLEAQLKALRYILNIDMIDDLRNLSLKINELNSEKYVELNKILDSIDVLDKNFIDFLDLSEHLSNELLIKYIKTDVKIFNIKKDEYSKLVRSNLNYQIKLEKYKDVIYNPKSLTWRSIDDIKLIELEINLKDTKLIKFLISKTDKFCHLIYKTILQYNSNIFESNSVDGWINLQNDIITSKNNLEKLKNNNYQILEDLERQFNYSDLKDLDLEFYYQFLIHINSLIYGIKNSKKVEINLKKYISNEQFVENNFNNNYMKVIKDRFVSKSEFKSKINQIENRLLKVEDNKSNYILGTMVISLISLFIWKKIINFKKKY